MNKSSRTFVCYLLNIIKWRRMSATAVMILFLCLYKANASIEPYPLYRYVLSQTGSQNSYDESMVVACVQGIVNREGPILYVLSDVNPRPQYWLDVFTSNEGWLQGRSKHDIPNLEELISFAGDKIKGAIIWDPLVPASINVATTIAGIEDGIVVSPEFANRYLSEWELPIIKDLRGMFTGKETGSKKNDAYRWAIRKYLAKGLCSNHWISLYEDAFSTRSKGDNGYVVTRDWAVKNRSFVYDLSPWGDEAPMDDLNQKIGTDLATYKMMLEEILKQTKGKEMTEIAGFFSFSKYSNAFDKKRAHGDVATEWETVYLISPYNCYQNTVASSCFNQSLHSQAPLLPLEQQKPTIVQRAENKTYLCFLMADYDSSTPLYEFMPTHWDDKRRGDIPLLWGINPNLIETFPDIIQYLYASKSTNDYFGADASAAGYMNPNRINKKHLPLFVKHNNEFYQKMDIGLSPMVLDWDEPTADVKDAFAKFSPDGFATIVIDFHEGTGKAPKPHVWKGMPVLELINSVGQISSTDQASDAMSHSIPLSNGQNPEFYFFRIVWTSPGQVIDAIDALKKKRPDLNIEVADPYSFFNMAKDYYGN